MADEPIADTHELIFDFASDNPREQNCRCASFLSRKADDFNNREVELRLDEQVDGTSHYAKYMAVRYTIRRSFTSEFDF